MSVRSRSVTICNSYTDYICLCQTHLVAVRVTARFTCEQPSQSCVVQFIWGVTSGHETKSEGGQFIDLNSIFNDLINLFRARDLP